MAAPSSISPADLNNTQDRILGIVRELLEELGSLGALGMLRPDSHLDRDLGLGSLERVELMARIERQFGARLPDSVIANSDTPGEISQALLRARKNAPADSPQGSALRAAVTAQVLHQEAAGGAGRLVEGAETLIDILRHRAVHDGARAHLKIIEEGPEGERETTLTFGDLYAAAERCAAELARRGVPAGGRVALMLPTSREFFVSYAGILLAGAIPVPIYPPFRADRIEEYASRQSAILRNAEACLLLTFRRAEAVARLVQPRVPSLRSVADARKLLEAADAAKPDAPGSRPTHLSGTRVRKAGDIALLQYTSGSTGDPKGVTLTHGNLLANMRAIGESVRIQPDDSVISWLPLYHDMGLIGAWLTPLYYGLPLVVMSPLAFLSRPERWLLVLHRHRGTIAAAPNFAYELCVRKIADRDIAGIDLSSWRAALNGAEPVHPETLTRFAERFEPFGFRAESMLPVYGLAEASLAVAMPPLGRLPHVDRIQRETFASQGRAVPASSEDSAAIVFVSAGLPVPRHEVRIVDEQGRELPERTEGALWFRGPSATCGYYCNAAATEKLFPAGPAAAEGEFPWMNSGDRAYLAGGEIFITGRVKDIIIKGGRNIYPHEVEELAARAEGVRKGCVVAFGLREEESATEKLVVVAESREADPARRAKIAASINECVSAGLGLPPDRIELVPPGSIPKTSSGKLRRDETRQLYVDGELSRRAQFHPRRLRGSAQHPAHSLRRLHYGRFLPLDRSHLVHRASLPRPPRRRPLHFPRAAPVSRAGGLPPARRGPRTHGAFRRENFCLQPHQLLRRSGGHGRAGRSLPLRFQMGSASNALHRDLPAQDEPSGLRPQRSGSAPAPATGDRRAVAPGRIGLCLSRGNLYTRGRNPPVSTGRV
ncbi:MAG: AMP-binding protein [Acidobacteriia bacterium]|nr:AMP-binding protein [Terriglobia bacterium]